MITAPDFIVNMALNSSCNLNVIVVGAGGTGSALLGKLFQLHNTLVGLGGTGLDVTVYDDDIVTPANTGRQQFYNFDIGRNKAEVLVERFNNFGDVSWVAVPERFSGNEIESSSVIFGCVDNVATRKIIHSAINSLSSFYSAVWIDCGNVASSGNVILGMKAKVNNKTTYLPTVVDLYHEQMRDYVDTNEDSCSHADAIQKQSVGINDIIAAYANQMLWRLIRHGAIEYQGVNVDLETGTTNSFKADPDIWAMYGYQHSAMQP